MRGRSAEASEHESTARREWPHGLGAMAAPFRLEVDEPGAPRLRLLDGRSAGLNESELREWARRESEHHDASELSRSYCHPFALVAWHAAPVGVDIERVVPCDRCFADLICTPEERQHAAQLPDPSEYLTTLWSSKEALSKLLGDARDYEPGRLASPLAWAERPPTRLRAAQLALPPGYTGWVCWQVAQDDETLMGPASNPPANDSTSRRRALRRSRAPRSSARSLTAPSR